MRLSVKPIKKTFTIEHEEYGEATVEIRQATTSDFISLQELTAEASIVIPDEFGGAQEIKQKINPAVRQREEVFLTLSDCSIVDEDDNPWFKFRNGKLESRASFEAAWGRLPPEVAALIHEKVIEVNPTFRPSNSDDLGE